MMMLAIKLFQTFVIMRMRMRMMLFAMEACRIVNFLLTLHVIIALCVVMMMMMILMMVALAMAALMHSPCITFGIVALVIDVVAVVAIIVAVIIVAAGIVRIWCRRQIVIDTTMRYWLLRWWQIIDQARHAHQKQKENEHYVEHQERIERHQLHIIYNGDRRNGFSNRAQRTPLKHPTKHGSVGRSVRQRFRAVKRNGYSRLLQFSFIIAGGDANGTDARKTQLWNECSTSEQRQYQKYFTE